MRFGCCLAAAALVLSITVHLAAHPSTSLGASLASVQRGTPPVSTPTPTQPPGKGSQPRKPVPSGGTAAQQAAAPTTLQDIVTGGPLQHIFIGNDHSCQVAFQGDSEYEFYPPGETLADCGTFVSVNSVLFGPNLPSRPSAASSLGNFTPFTPLSQSGVTGSGTTADPYKVATSVTLGNLDITLTETDSYVAGATSYRTDLALFAIGSIGNSGLLTAGVRVFRAADCFMGDDDRGFGVLAPSDGIGCAKTANDQPPGRAVRFEPLTPANGYYESYFDNVWS